MRTIAHISDLHFGREEARVAEALLADIEALAPSLVAVSGDLTQRARRREFAAARDYLRRLRGPTLVVPGNHDIPLFDVFRRFFRPLHRYRRYIAEEVMPFHRDEELAVLGVNTARRNHYKHGRVSIAQIEEIRAHFGTIPESVFKVIVTHHPFIPPPDEPAPPLVGRGPEALKAAEAAGVDLLLAGHMHFGYSGDVRAHHPVIRRSILVAQAGTAISRRLRREANAYNLIRIEPPHLSLQVRGWSGTRFEPKLVERYVKRDDVWHREA
jgi:3',5'-cyclic AMP phosphodiesterase CpdA